MGKGVADEGLESKGSKGEGKLGGAVKASDGLAMKNEGIKPRHSNGSKQAGKATEGGLSRVLEPEKNVDEFGKGTVGHPEETEAIREDGNQEGLGDETLLYGGGYFEREAPDLEDGISLRQTLDPDKAEPNYNYDIDPLTGNAPERKVGRTNNYNVRGKRGNEFEVGEM